MSAERLCKLCHGRFEYYQDAQQPRRFYVFFDLDELEEVPHVGDWFQAGPFVGTCSGVDWDMREVVMLVEIEEGA